MRKTKITVLFVLIALTGFAQHGGLGIYKFLDLPVPARTAALGGNTIALEDDDVTLAVQNPGLLTKECHNQLALGFVDYFGDIKYSYLGYARNYEKIGTFGFGMQYVNYGTFQSADEYGVIDGTFKAADYSLNLTYSRAKDSTFTYGATIKTIYSQYERFVSVGNAVDLGATYHNHKYNFTIGLAARNFGYQWKSYSGTGREKLDGDFQIGITKKIPKAPFRVSIVYQYLDKYNLRYEDPANPEPTVDPFTGEPIKEKKFSKFMDNLGRHFIAGAEVIITKNFHLRVGYNYMRQREMKLPDRKSWGGLTFGFGFKVYKIHISYAHASYHVAGKSNHFTLTSRLSDFKRKEKKEEPVVQPEP